MVRALIILLCGLCLFSAVVGPARADERTFRELLREYTSNRALKRADLAVFPAAMQAHLGHADVTDWRSRGISGFSRKIGRRTLLVAVDREGMGFTARAAVYTSGERWRPVFLPSVQRGGPVISRIEFPRLEWGEKASSFHTTLCSDVGPGNGGENVCWRSYYDIGWSETRLTKIERLGKTGFPTTEWNTVWENGNWVAK